MATRDSKAAIHLLADKIASIRSQAQPYADRIKQASPGIVKLAIHEIRVCNALVRYLGDLLVGTFSEEDLDLEVSKIAHAILILARTTRFFASDDNLINHYDSLSPWENLVKSISADADVIIRSQSAYEFESYLEIRDMLERILPLDVSRADVFRGFPKHFIVLNIPIVQAWNVLHYALLAHEIGHFIYNVEQLEQIPLAVVPEYRERLVEFFKRERGTTPDLEAFDDEFSRFLQTWSKVITSRYKELMSDTFGAYIIGPCILFALRDFGLPGFRLDFAPGDGERFLGYPSFRKRFLLLLQAIRPFTEGTFRTETADNKRAVRRLRRFLKTWGLALRQPAAAADDRYGLIEQIVDECVTRALTKVSAANYPWRYDAALYRTELFELYNRILDDIPPNEIRNGQAAAVGTPAHWQSILNAAWLYYLDFRTEKFDVFRWNDGKLSEDTINHRHKSLRRFNDFVTRSIELSIVHERFLKDKRCLEGILDDPVEIDD